MRVSHPRQAPLSDIRFQKAVGVRVRDARLAAGLTQLAVSAAIRISRASIANIELGRQGAVQLKTLRRFGRLFRMDYRDFLPLG